MPVTIDLRANCARQGRGKAMDISAFWQSFIGEAFFQTNVFIAVLRPTDPSLAPSLRDHPYRTITLSGVWGLKNRLILGNGNTVLIGCVKCG